MSKIYEQWRDLSIDPFSINFKNITLKSIISYPPAGNDVIECICSLNGVERNVIIKIERSKVSDFYIESINLKKLKSEYNIKVADVIEIGKCNNKYYIVLEKIEGERLSDIINDGITQEEKENYLKKYGKELARIHKIPPKNFNNAKIRPINDIPKIEDYKEFDSKVKKYIDYLSDNMPVFNKNTFIHGDFHYANILWKNKDINGILDLEYSGKGFKEQDIAWTCILRNSQTFMDNINDIKCFLKGYLEENTYNIDYLRWCIINGYCHFYLMNIKNEEYNIKILKMLETIINYDFNI